MLLVVPDTPESKTKGSPVRKKFKETVSHYAHRPSPKKVVSPTLSWGGSSATQTPGSDRKETDFPYPPSQYRRCTSLSDVEDWTPPKTKSLTELFNLDGASQGAGGSTSPTKALEPSPLPREPVSGTKSPSKKSASSRSSKVLEVIDIEDSEDEGIVVKPRRLFSKRPAPASADSAENGKGRTSKIKRRC